MALRQWHHCRCNWKQQCRTGNPLRQRSQQQKQQLLPWQEPVLHREDATPLRANSKNCSAGKRPALGRPLHQRARLRRPQKERRQQKARQQQKERRWQKERRRQQKDRRQQKERQQHNER